MDLSILKLRGRSSRQLGAELLRVLYLAEIPSLIVVTSACFLIPWSWIWLVSLTIMPIQIVGVCQHRLQSIPSAVNAYGMAEALFPAPGIKTGNIMKIRQLGSRLQQTGRRQKRVQLMALGCCMLISMVCLWCAGQEQLQYNDIWKVPDFTLEVPGIVRTNHQNQLNAQQLAAIETVHGVKRTSLSTRESGWRMNWDDYGQSCIRDIFKQDGAFIELSPNENGNLALYPELIVLQDGPLKDQVLDLADVSEETFGSGDSAVICLPAFQHFYQEEYGSGEIRDHDFASEKSVWSETTIQPGTKITLSDSDQNQKELTIQGTLKDPSAIWLDPLSLWDQVPGAGSPYSLFVDESFLENSYTTVHVWAETASGSLTEKQISQLASRMKLNLKNRYPEKTKLLDSLRFQYRILYLLSAGSGLACFLILFQLLRQQNHKLEILCLQLRQLFIPPAAVEELKSRFRIQVLFKTAIVLIMAAFAGWYLTPDITNSDQAARLYYQLPESEEFDLSDNP